jgi:putative membrane protein
MRKLLRTVLAVVGLLLIVTFAVANRQPAEISFWPLAVQREVPLFVVLLVGIVLGVVLAGIAGWLSGHRRRVGMRHLRDRVADYERQDQRRRAAEDQAAVERMRGPALPAPSGAR